MKFLSLSYIGQTFHGCIWYEPRYRLCENLEHVVPGKSTMIVGFGMYGAQCTKCKEVYYADIRFYGADKGS